MTNQSLTEHTASPLESEGHRGPTYELGEWFWYHQEQSPSEPTLMCIMEIGSNYYLLEEPSVANGGHREVRVHQDNAPQRLTHEPESARHILERQQAHQRRAQELVAEVQALTARLGLPEQGSLGYQERTPSSDNLALAVLSDQTDLKAYEQSLIKARKDDLPELFKAIERENAEVARWMTASIMPAKAQARSLKGVVKEVNQRILNVSLYAGLGEQITQICEGKPASMGTPLHIMQRRLYMDEECLLNYRVGGMEFNDIAQFDRWLAEPENLTRVLPFPRCIVAMRVRRTEKEREGDGSLKTALINFQLRQLDQLTFLYIRNGEHLYRLETEHDFGELIFPDKATFDPSEPLMVEMFGGRVRKIITRREYDDRLQKTKQIQEQREQWKKDNPYEQWRESVIRQFLHTWDTSTEIFRRDNAPKARWLERMVKREASHTHYLWQCPYDPFNRGDRIVESDWGPYDRSNVYYDVISEVLANKMRAYNRIALIIQGLFDRSQALHPHPPVKTWDPESFASNITLVYDGSDLLTYGEPPDIKAYIQSCNDSLRDGSVVVGQEGVWLQREADKEACRRQRNSRESEDFYLERFRPYGNPGPGYLARIDSWRPRVRKAKFSWYRERRVDGGHGKQFGDPVRTTLTVDADELFNCDGYQQGDYKQFFQDPRTRAQYLHWAPMLLAAEEYKAGSLKPQEPAKAK